MLHYVFVLGDVLCNPDGAPLHTFLSEHTLLQRDNICIKTHKKKPKNENI